MRGRQAFRTELHPPWKELEQGGKGIFLIVTTEHIGWVPGGKLCTYKPIGGYRESLGRRSQERISGHLAVI